MYKCLPFNIVLSVSETGSDVLRIYFLRKNFLEYSRPQQPNC